MLKSTLALLLGITQTSYAQEMRCAPDVVCSIYGNSTQIIYADDSVPALVVNCLGKGSCKKNGIDDGLIVYSSANKTFVICEGEDACEECSLNFGITPPGGNSLDYEVDRDTVKVECLGKQSGKSLSINTNGFIRNGLKVITSETNDATLMGARIECGTSKCSIDCQSRDTLPDTCKAAKCYGDCSCLPANAKSGCPPGLNVRPTPEPTPSPVDAVIVPPPLPTPKPTPSPVDPRNATGCATGTCVIDGSENFDIDCAATATKCVVNCLREGSCAEGVIIQANSPIVEVNCGESNSCDQLKIFGVEANTITVTLEGNTAAEHLMIVVDNLGATLVVNALGDESLTSGRIFCDADCTTNCAGNDACKSLIYECLNTADKCKCVGEDCVVNNFGDQSCTTKACEPEADGNTRIVALNNVDTLAIDCTQKPGQCKNDGLGLRIYTAAKNTVINCQTVDGCEEMTVSCGDLKGSQVPKGFTEDEFVVSLATDVQGNPTEQQTVTVYCDNESACKGASFYATGKCNIIIKGDGEDALVDATLVCDDCESMNFECKNYDGCGGTTVLCPSVPIGQENRCVCNEVFVYVNLTIETTETPRQTCPDIGVLPRLKSVVAAQNNVKGLLGQGTRALVAFVIVGSLLVLAAGFIFMKCKKGYTEIKDGQNNEQMLKNENIYATYQVEMH